MGEYALQSQFPEDTSAVDRALSEIRGDFKGRSHELIPMLQGLQKLLGYLPERVLLEVAHFTGLPAATVFGVATFYAQFRLQPVGKYIVRVCRGTACHVRGSGRILKDIQTRFQITPGQTTEDRLYTLETVACFGSCALAPVIVMHDSVHGRMNPSRVRRILEALQAEEEAASVRRTTSSMA